MSVTCPKCSKVFSDERTLKIHNTRKHDYNKNKIVENAIKRHSKHMSVTPEICIRFFEMNYPSKSIVREIRSFNFFLDHVRHLREPSVSDVELYSGRFKEWRDGNPQSKYTMEACRIIALDEDEKTSDLYEKMVKVMNPFANHGSELSPSSRKFNGYKGLNKRDAEKKFREHIEHMSECRMNGKPSSNTVEYYTNLGFTPEVAAEKRSERQRTFTLEKCIARHGDVEGTSIYNERQRKWLEKLNSKSPEEQIRINEAKTHNGLGCISKIEKEMGEKLKLSENQCNCVRLRHNESKHYKYDFCIGNKILEFNGDYWHCNPLKYAPTYFNTKLKMTAEEKWKKDADKIKLANENGYEVKVVWEQDYRRDPDGILRECREFLGIE